MTSTTTPPVVDAGTSGRAAPTRRSAADATNDVLTETATAVMLPFTLARQLLPDSPVPVVLGAGALAVAGVIEWPAVAAVTLGYLALRRWPRPSGRPA